MTRGDDESARLLTYRWRNVHGGDMFFLAYIDPQGGVTDTRQGSELPGNAVDPVGHQFATLICWPTSEAPMDQGPFLRRSTDTGRKLRN